MSSEQDQSFADDMMKTPKTKRLTDGKPTDVGPIWRDLDGEAIANDIETSGALQEHTCCGG